jgi:RimJ/RimL family protein N-acetyltransferase
MIVEAGAADAAQIEHLLSARIEQAMFPLSNLRDHGLTKGDFASPHDHSVRIWRTEDSLIALTRAGMILPLLDGTPDLAGLPDALTGLTVTGAVGPAPSVRPVLAALGLDRHPTTTNRDEPGFALTLDRLILPDRPTARLRPITPADLPLLTDWRETYIGEVMGIAPAKARPRARKDIEAYLPRNSHRLLLIDDQPVAMTGFNAILPDIVQVGGVFTPPPLRGRGFGRLAVALHLAEARANGVIRAVLFAANDAAARAYRAIGFQPAQTFKLFLLSTPTVIRT